MTDRHILRRFFAEDELWLEARAYSRAEAWLDITQNLASYRPRSFAVSGLTVQLDRGEFVVACSTLASRWGWEVTKVKRFLVWLKSNNRLTHRQMHHAAHQPGYVYQVVGYGGYHADVPEPAPRSAPPDAPHKVSTSTKTLDSTESKVKAPAEKSAQPPLVARMGDLWKSLRGMPSYPRIGRAVKRLAGEGDARIWATWDGYLEERQGKAFATPEDFVENFTMLAEKYAYVLGEQGERIAIPREAA